MSSMLKLVGEYKFYIVLALVLLESLFLIWSSFQTGAVAEAYSFLYFNSATFGHLMAYMVYGCLLGMLFLIAGNSNKKSVAFALVIGASFGIINELIQSGVPGRYLDMMDIIVNTVGSAIGALISTRIRFRNHKVA